MRYAIQYRQKQKAMHIAHAQTRTKIRFVLSIFHIFLYHEYI